MYMFVYKKNHTLVIDSPFQTFKVGLFIEFIDFSSATAFSRNAFFVEQLVYNAHHFLFIGG